MLRICAFFLLFSQVFADTSFNPTKCEVCVIVSNEFVTKTTKIMKRTEMEFENLLDHFCQNFNEYKVHKERTGISRFARGPSKTIETLKEMRAKGVKVEIGLPYEMWDAPSAEITLLRQGCEVLMEDFEEVIQAWFFNKQKTDLTKLLCLENALKTTQEKDCIMNGHMEL